MELGSDNYVITGLVAAVLGLAGYVRYQHAQRIKGLRKSLQEEKSENSRLLDTIETLMIAKGGNLEQARDSRKRAERARTFMAEHTMEFSSQIWDLGEDDTI